MDMKKSYYAKSKVREENILFCTFDTETDGLGGKLLCTTWSNMGGTDIKIGAESIEYWLDHVFFHLPFPCIHYAHFAQYDWRYIIPILLKRQSLGEYTDVKFNLRTDKDIYQIEVKIGKKKYIMRDSYALYPDTLRNFAKDFAPDFQKLDIDFEKTRFDPSNDDHLEYAKRDAESLRHALMNYSVSVNKLFGVSIGHTAAGTAVKAWQKTLDDEIIISYSRDCDRERFIRNAYFGGVVFLTSNKPHFNAKTIDINSSYPYTMETYPMPIGAPICVSDYVPNRLGIYLIDIETPDDLIVPIIPSRNPRGNMEWRKGRFKTCVTNFEMEFAVKHRHKIHGIEYGYIWENTFNPFQEFIQKCKYIRKEHKGTSYEGVAKRNQNSLYGKFGAKRITNRIIFGQENLSEDDDAKLFSHEMDDVYIVSEYSEDMPCIPEWSVFITAIARLRLLSAAYAIGIEHILYGDTDSLTVKESGDISKADIGDEYGQFKLEKTWKCFRAIAPKTYAGKIESGKNAGRWSGAGKGLSANKMTQAKYKELYESGKTEVEYLSLPSLVVALRKGIDEATLQSRVSSKLENSVNFALQNGKVLLRSKYHESENNPLPGKKKRA